MKPILARGALLLYVVYAVALAALQLVALLALAPVHAYCRRWLCLHEGPGDLKALNEAMDKAFEKMRDEIKKVQDTASNALEEVRKEGTVHTKTNEKLTEVDTAAKKAAELVIELKDRITDVEQKMSKRGPDGGPEMKSAGQLFVESEQFKKADVARCKYIDPVVIGTPHRKTAIVNASGQNQPLVPDQRVPGIVTPPERRMTIRDLLPQMATGSNLVQFVRELLYTNNAAIVFNSPDSRENVQKPESAMTFELANAPVVTIAHWIPASRQILEDAPGLQSYINGRLMYGLRYAEEAQLLNGDGTGGNVNGLNTAATAYNRGVSNDTKLDALLKAKLQVTLSEFPASGYILNPIDWTSLLLLKDTTNRYLFSQPQDVTQPRIWGLPVVDTQAQTETRFTVGAFDLAAAIWDREDATVRVAEQHDDFFTKNMVAILCEERLALTVYRPTAIIYGTLPSAGT